MFSVFGYNNFSRSILCIIFFTFSLTYCLPLRAGWSEIIGVSPEVDALAEIKNLVEKMNKLKKSKDRHKMYKTMLAIKKEAEKLAGKKLVYLRV